MRQLFQAFALLPNPIRLKFSVMPNRVQQNGLVGVAARNGRMTSLLTSLGLLVVAIINIIVVGGVILVRAPLAGWAA